MKILQAVHLYPPAVGGIEHHTYQLSEELVRQGHEVEVFTSKIPQACKNEIINGVKIRRFFSISIPFFSSLRFSPSMLLALLASNSDIYCSHGYGSPVPFFTSIAAWIKRKPFIFTLHGYPKLTGIGGLMKTIYKLFMASVFLRIARKVIIVSKASQADIESELDLRKIIYIPNGIDAQNYATIPFFDKKTISYVGRLDKYKGIDRLIRAFSKLSPNYRELKLGIIGHDEGIKRDLKALCQNLNIDNKVFFNEVQYSKIKYTYYESLAVVLASLYEGFPLIWMETIASSRPMFSSKVGDYKYFFSIVYGDNSELFLFDNEDDLVKKLRYFLENKKIFEPIVKTAREKLLNEFSWTKVTRDTLKVYEMLIK